MGLGVVGSGVAKVLTEKVDPIARRVGCPLSLKKILVRSSQRPRSVEIPRKLLTTSAQDFLADPSIDIVIEAIGGESPALEFIEEALRRGKHVVTANKEVIAKHGPELMALASEKGVELAYEASVGGGIPLVGPFKEDLLANKISAIHAIINGTTNYILTRMAKDGLDFDTALSEAKALGYAEPDPTNDIEGIDAAYKLAILATLAFHAKVRPADVYCEGISRLTAKDFRYGRELGYAIKLLAIAKEENGSIQARVHPTFIPEDMLLAKVDGVFNAVQVEGDLVGRVIFYGRGAGALPTASAIIADVINTARIMLQERASLPRLQLDPSKTTKPISSLDTRYYIRMTVADMPGVLAQISRVLGERLISISAVIQKEADERSQTAEIVILTHPALESSVTMALRELEGLKVVKEISSFIRVEI